MTLKFKEWEALNEANLFSKIKDWFSSNFGGSLGKLEGLLYDYKKLELEFVDEWQEIAVEIDKLELEKGQAKNDPAALKKAERYIQRNNEVLVNAKKAHAKKIDHLMNVVKDVIGDSRKLQNFWETNKSKVDADVAEEMYKRSKDLADTSTSRELYDKYKKSVLVAKERDLEFRNKYGDLINRENKKEEAEKSKGSAPSTEASADLYVSMSLADFTKAVSSLTPAQAKSLVSSLIKQRNELYVQMDVEREALNDQISGKTGTGVSREEAAKRIKEIREKYMETIRDLRSKITIARKNA
jgi:hypothetical protein